MVMAAPLPRPPGAPSVVGRGWPPLLREGARAIVQKPGVEQLQELCNVVRDAITTTASGGGYRHPNIEALLRFPVVAPAAAAGAQRRTSYDRPHDLDRLRECCKAMMLNLAQSRLNCWAHR